MTLKSTVFVTMGIFTNMINVKKIAISANLISGVMMLAGKEHMQRISKTAMTILKGTASVLMATTRQARDVTRKPRDSIPIMSGSPVKVCATLLIVDM